MNRDQHGFGLIEIALVIIVVGVLGATGWYALNSKHKTDQILNQAAKISQNSPISSPKYLVIKEWGVKVPLSPAISDAVYYINSTSPNGAYVSLASLQNIDSCKLGKNNTTGVGVIVRFGKDDINPDSLSTPPEKFLTDFPNAPHIGQYYYDFEPDNQANCSNDQSVVNKLMPAKTAFTAQILKISQE